VFNICFGICIYVCGCKYLHELCYKYPISSMGVMSLWLSCCYLSDGGFLHSRLIVVNITTRKVINLLGKYVFIFNGLLVCRNH